MDGLNFLRSVFRGVANLPRFICASKRTTEAFDLAAKERYTQALKSLNSANKWGDKLTPEARLLEIYLFYRLKKFEMARELANKFESSMKSVNSRFLNRDEAHYLIGYCALIQHTIDLREGHADQVFPEVSRDNVELSRVRSALKKTFPLVNHVDWKFPRDSTSSR